MLRRKIRRPTLKAAVSLLVLCGLARAAGAQPPDAGADEPCRLIADSVPAAFARCGTLRVPEDPARPDGPHVDLFWARIAALSGAPRSDPLLIITGGPGQSAVDFYLSLRGAFEQVRRERDLILLDQRGTGRSAAGFQCAVPEDLALETAGLDALGRYAQQCLGSLEHDPRFYTTSVAVQDLDRLRAELDVEQWSVYGVSYGTRVAQHYARRFPERVRALILDGVVPAEVALGPEVAIYAQRALEQIFARCAADAACGAAFSDLPARFAALAARLEAEPYPMPPAVAPGAERRARRPSA